MTTPTPLPRVAAIAILLFCAVDSRSQDDGIPLAPPENRRPSPWRPSESVTDHEALIKASEEVRRDAAREYRELQRTNADGKWKPTAKSIDTHDAPEWFKDAKFGMFIDYGPWSIAGWAPKKQSGQMIPDWYEGRMYNPGVYRAYHEKNWGDDFERDDFLPLFTAKDYDPARLVELAEETGMKYVVPFCKHHAGFCMWPSAFTRRDAGDMGPHRDLIAPLAKQCRDRGLKFGFYLSVEEWEYPLLDANDQLVLRQWGGATAPYTPDLDRKVTGKIPARDYATEYLVPQAKEFIDAYDPDIIWYDGDWSTSPEQLHTYDIAAYLYNRAEGRKDVAVNDRYGRTRSGRGDFFTSEYGAMHDDSKKETHAWEECRGISQSYGYNWQDTEDNVITSKQLIDMFVDIVANGGNLLLMVNLDGQGALPNVQANRLRDIGKWLRINGEGIYATRPYRPSGGQAGSNPAGLDLARWIWFPEGDPTVGAPVERRYFRRTFMLPEDHKIKKAFCRMGADNEFDLYVNAQPAGQGRHYASAYDMDVKRFLRPGQNLLTVSAANAPDAPAERNPAGLIGVLHIEFDQGEPLTIVTDGNWRVSKDATDGWHETGRDDAGWSAAKDLGEYGMSPWGKLNTDTVAKRSAVFTQSKDGSVVYVILKQWPGQEFKTDVIEPLPNSPITMLGYDKPLRWKRQGVETTVFLPEELQVEKSRPGEHVWVLKVERTVAEK